MLFARPAAAPEARRFVVDLALGPFMMQWTAPTRRHLGAKMVVFMNHGETGAVL